MDTTQTSGTETDATEHRECVGEAAVQIFNAACGIELQPCQDDQDLGEDGAVIGVISVVGEVDWSIFLGLPKATAVALSAQFAGFEIPFDSEDMGDAIGELTNILAGEVKRQLETRSVEATISLPSVLRAESLHVVTQKGTVVTKNCFVCEAGKLWTGVISTKEGGFVA